ncbi:MAG: DUF3187 family protein [Betaproteobacteria bacterium]
MAARKGKSPSLLHSRLGPGIWMVASLFSADAAFAGEAASPATGFEKSGGYEKYGFLRERDLTPFGFLRLDMRPASAEWIPAGGWGLEAQLGYQNTWAFSNNVRDYLSSQGGRRTLTQADANAIRALPGEGYLVDLELGMLDFVLHRQLTNRWSVNASVSAVHYGGGFLDSTIEDFHKTFGFGTDWRNTVARNRANLIFNLKGVQSTYIDSVPEGGLLDPVLGVRYSLMPGPSPLNLVLEGSVKVPVAGERNFLSTGNADVGVQATLQAFSGRHAGYLSAAAVRTRGDAFTPYDRTQIIPTYIVGYELSLTHQTAVIGQFSMSPGVLNHNETDLPELLANKYQISFGVRHRVDASVFSVAFTENMIKLNNTPDIGFQFAWTYSPSIRR